MIDLLYKGRFEGLDIAFTYAVTTSAVNEAVERHNCDPAAHILGRAMTGALLAAPGYRRTGPAPLPCRVLAVYEADNGH